ncbi:MAG: 50S ribosomal protein L5 [Lentisphaerae bacterium]|nr:50S ribosomal protein L5 [Lentisphaerota bacterium]
MTARLKETFRTEVIAAMQKDRGYGNAMQVPRIQKIVLNMGFDADTDRDTMKVLVEDLGKVAGQKPVVTKAKKSISNFRLREGMAIGARVTLRGERMYEFLDRLIAAALPRIRDFRGVPARSFDGRGNYTLGVKEQTIFPEINPDHVKKVQGMDITFVTNAGTDDEARDLLRRLGMPFAK